MFADLLSAHFLLPPPPLHQAVRDGLHFAHPGFSSLTLNATAPYASLPGACFELCGALLGDGHCDQERYNMANASICSR